MLIFLYLLPMLRTKDIWHLINNKLNISGNNKFTPYSRKHNGTTTLALASAFEYRGAMEIHICLTFLIKRKHLYELAFNNTESLFIRRRNPVG